MVILKLSIIYKVIHHTQYDFHKNTIKEFDIYRAVKFNKENVLNDKLSFQSNYIYDTAIKVLEGEGNMR